MQVQVSTDNHLKSSEKLKRVVQSELDGAVGRFAHRITRVAVYLSDANSTKSGIDKRCVLEARVAGQQPLVVDHHAEGLNSAISGAADKLQRLVTRTLEKRGARKGNVSFSGDWSTSDRIQE